MKDEIKISPKGRVDSHATLRTEPEYYEVETGKKVSTAAIESAIKLGLSIEPKYKQSNKVELKLKLNYTDITFSKDQFESFAALFGLLSKEVAKLTQKQVKTLSTLDSYYIKTVKKRVLVETPLMVTFPGGEEVELTEKLAKLVALKSFVPAKFLRDEVHLSTICAHKVIYYAGNATFKIGCNTITNIDLKDYFRRIEQAWKKLEDE